MSQRNGWAGPRATKARAYLTRKMAATRALGKDVICWRCEQPITVDDEWHVGHIVDIETRPDLTWAPSNWAPEHARTCNLRASAHKTNAKRATKAKRLWSWT